MLGLWLDCLDLCQLHMVHIHGRRCARLALRGRVHSGRTDDAPRTVCLCRLLLMVVVVVVVVVIICRLWVIGYGRHCAVEP